MITIRPLAVLGTFTLLLALPALAAGPGEIKFDQTGISVSEGVGMAIVTVERSGGEDGAVSVDYATSDGTATQGSDYTAVSGTLSWNDGDGSDKTFTLPILDDSDSEGAETIQLTLSNATGGATLSPSRSAAVVTIQASDGGSGGGGGGGGGDDNGGNGGDDNGGDDNGGNGGDDNGGGTGALKFDQRNFLVLESGGVAVISVERSRGETGAVSVDYSTADGSATAGSDYTAASGTLSWGDGDESRKTFQVPILSDGNQEGAEDVQLILSNPTGGATLDGERARAILTILDSGDQIPPGEDNSRPGVLKFDERGFQVIEGQSRAVIRVERSRGSRGTVSVEYSTSDGSATEGGDYTGVSGVLSWANGDRGAKTFEVPILEDDVSEGNETVNLTLSNPVGGASLDPERGTSVLSILDNDGSTTACTDDSTTLCLEDGRFEVRTVWRTSDGNSGVGQVIPSTDSSGLVWFFAPNNVEMLIKVLDACKLPGFQSYWVFFAATTNVDFTVTVTDTATGITKEYMNPAGQAAEPIQDTISFKTCL